MRTISIRLDDATDARLRQLCSRTQQSQTDIIKAAIVALADREDHNPRWS
jgi:predicted transcriptional regulator